jgi:hypothetical protein
MPSTTPVSEDRSQNEWQKTAQSGRQIHNPSAQEPDTQRQIQPPSSIHAVNWENQLPLPVDVPASMDSRQERLRALQRAWQVRMKGVDGSWLSFIAD